MTEVYRSRYSVLKVERICVSTGIVEYGVQERTCVSTASEGLVAPEG